MLTDVVIMFANITNINIRFIAKVRRIFHKLKLLFFLNINSRLTLAANSAIKKPNVVVIPTGELPPHK